MKQKIQPDERGGGILADEMGMGKSLSILSLIVKTLDDARNWAVEEEKNSEKSKDLHYSGSTLVVVSSARKSSSNHSTPPFTNQRTHNHQFSSTTGQMKLKSE